MTGRAKPADVVIIGMGHTAGVAVGPLTAAGLQVVALEAGPRRSASEYAPDEIVNDIRNHLGATKANLEVPTVRATADDEAGPPIYAAPMANGVGGSAIHSTSQYFRLLPWHFRERSATLERYGPEMLPSGSTVVDWPYSYEELEPYYAAVEDLLGVSGCAGNVAGELCDGGNPLEGPRSGGYPLPPLRRTGYTEMMSEAARTLGWHPYPGAAAIRSQPYRELPGCTYCGFCTYGGCWADARGLTSLGPIPAAEASGNLDIVTGARVLRIETDADGRARGVTYLREGAEIFQPAAAVILSTFCFENSRLLLLSRSDSHPAGIGNDHDQVGRHILTHQIVFGQGLFPGRQLNLMSGTGAQSTVVDDWEGDNFDHTGLGFIGGSAMSMQMEAKPIATARATPPSVPGWGTEWKAFLREHSQSIGNCLMQIEQTPHHEDRFDLDPTVTDPSGMPVIRATIRHRDSDRNAYAFMTERMREWFTAAGATEVWVPPLMMIAVSAHVYGGTRMGLDPATSVVDADGRIHDTPNVAVLGASTMPTSGGRNPSLTAQAAAWRTADHLVRDWDQVAG